MVLNLPQSAGQALTTESTQTSPSAVPGERRCCVCMISYFIPRGLGREDQRGGSQSSARSGRCHVELGHDPVDLMPGPLLFPPLLWVRTRTRCRAQPATPAGGGPCGLAEHGPV